MSDAPATDYSLAELLDRVRELEVALRPFAKLYGMFGHLPDDRRVLSTAIGDIVARDIKTARRAVAD
jgi:hypothetical protein